MIEMVGDGRRAKRRRGEKCYCSYMYIDMS